MKKQLNKKNLSKANGGRKGGVVIMAKKGEIAKMNATTAEGHFGDKDGSHYGHFKF